LGLAGLLGSFTTCFGSHFGFAFQQYWVG
jgi:hypothetical protein